jgi:hypothetical protein
MNSRLIRFIKAGTVLSVILGLSSVAMLAQNGQGRAGQQPTGGVGQANAAASPAAKQPFDPHDFSGIWRVRQQTNQEMGGEIPPMTPWAQAKFEAAKPGFGPKQQPLGNDPIMICDPIGYPKILFWNAYPIEILQTHDRVIEFFDFFYAHRTIYTDGRELPKDPETTWYGYSVGHWEGDTFVVKSNGFNGRTWLDDVGHPFSEEMTLEEHYRRIDHDDIEVTIMLTDPKAYTKPWVSETKTLRWSPKEVMREDVCAPSDEKRYLDEVREPAGTVPRR